MKKKSASQSAPARRSPSEGGFFNLRVLIGLFVVLAGVFLALAGLGTFSAITANSAQAQQKHKIIDLQGLPPGFDCATIHEKGIDKMEGFRAGLIMIACGESRGGSASTSPLAAVNAAIQKVLPPLAFGAGDVDVVTGTETTPHIIQSETFTTVNPDNPNQIVVCYNDSRGAAANNFSGCSTSTDGGTTFTRLTTGGGNSPFANTFGDPVVLYNKLTGTWFTVWLDGVTGCGGLGGYKSTTPWDPNSWTHFCVNANSFDDRESGYADNSTSSSFPGRMYVSWNDFDTANADIFVRYSTDNGLTWPNLRQVSSGGFFRNVQITADKVTGDVYIAGMDENSGNGCLSGCPTNRNNKIYRSTDGGNSWTNTYTGPTFLGACRSFSGYFCGMYSGGYWRHMSWGEPAAYNHVVHLVYAQHGAGADPGDVYYIRSTDSGGTFGAPFKLNTDGGTGAQWQPNLSVSDAGTLFAMWYDERTGGSCTPGANTPCYQMFARKSNDNGLTWLPDDTLSDVVSPLPAQNDPNIVTSYVGDYDYGSAILVKHATSWVDGRVLIGGSSQQDAFTDRELVGFAATSTTPACNSTINTQPVDFIVNLSDPALPSSVQASDFTVNGTPANSFTYSGPPSTQITFHFNSSPVVTQGLQTMHIPAGAILRNSDSMPIFEFNCTFCYAITPLQVTTTVPPVGGTFSPPAPGDYTYDVNFNQAVDPASVQTSDLTLTMGSVTAVSVVNGNTARFTLHFNFGGSVTASIGAGAITANGCNGNAAFAGDYTVEGCPSPDHYDIAQIGGSIVPGTTDIGNHGDDVVTTIALPFNYTLYDQSFNAINLSSNGNAQFTTTDNNWVNSCPLPWPTHNYSVFPYWDDQRTDVVGGTGIFTSTTGSTPDRIFNIEWRTSYFSGAGGANYELRLYEGQLRFDVIYGTVDQGNTSATAGVQKNDSAFDQYFCNGGGGAASGGQSYTLPGCTPTPTPTPAGQIVLRARKHRLNQNLLVHLKWTGANSSNIDIYRNGVVIATVPNTGSYTDTLTTPGDYIYKVCEAGTGNCSNEQRVRFGGGGP